MPNTTKATAPATNKSAKMGKKKIRPNTIMAIFVGVDVDRADPN